MSIPSDVGEHGERKDQLKGGSGLPTARLPTGQHIPGGSVVKNLPDSAGDAEDLGSIPGLGRSPGEGKCYPLQYSGLENSMDSIVHGGHKE